MGVTYVSHGKGFRCCITLALMLVLILVLVRRDGGGECSDERGAKSGVGGGAAAGED